jgi:hypothetical protein
MTVQADGATLVQCTPLSIAIPCVPRGHNGTSCANAIMILTQGQDFIYNASLLLLAVAQAWHTHVAMQVLLLASTATSTTSKTRSVAHVADLTKCNL